MHCLTATSPAKKEIKIRQPIDVYTSTEPIPVDIHIPVGDASVAGKVLSGNEQPLFLFNRDLTITAHINPSQGQYHISHLPAGTYTIGNYFILEQSPLCEFDLRPGERKTLDLNTHDWNVDVGRLLLHIINRNGHLLSHAQAWLEGALGRREPSGNHGESLWFFVPMGDYTLNIHCEGYADYRESITVEPVALTSSSQEHQAKVICLEGP
jgi:hypothetical protein